MLFFFYSLTSVIMHCIRSYSKEMYFILSGFRFSRCSYLLSLLRPHIYADLELKVNIVKS